MISEQVIRWCFPDSFCLLRHTGSCILLRTKTSLKFTKTKLIPRFSLNLHNLKCKREIKTAGDKFSSLDCQRIFCSFQKKHFLKLETIIDDCRLKWQKYFDFFGLRRQSVIKITRVSRKSFNESLKNFIRKYVNLGWINFIKQYIHEQYFKIR